MTTLGRRKRNFKDLKREVIDESLCTHCGNCVGVCAVSCLDIWSDRQRCEPQEVANTCTDCELCYRTCPGAEFDFGAFRAKLHGSKSNSRIGIIRRAYLGHAQGKVIRRSGASGGVITALLVSLLRNGDIDGAVVVDAIPGRPWLFSPKIATTEEEIIAAAKSKYVLVPSNVILQQTKRFRGRLAFVGLPCEIEALQKTQDVAPSLVKNIILLIGLYCGSNLYYEATCSLLKRFGIEDYAQIASLQYRDGTWPGNFQVDLVNGQSFSISKDAFNYLTFFYCPERCMLCADPMSEFADISVGDGWAYEKNGEQGWSVVLTRTEAGQNYLDQACSNGLLHLEEISEYQVVQMHSHTLSNKKVGSFIRMQYRQLRGLRVPDYGLEPPTAGLSRWMAELIVIAVMWICSWHISKKLIDHVPLSVLDSAMSRVRNGWRWLTRRRITSKAGWNKELQHEC